MKQIQKSIQSVLLIAGVFMGFSSLLISQVLITGKVMDGETKSPLSYANVQSRSNFTSTDIDGRFRISIDQGNDTLVISYVGFAQKIIPIDTDNPNFELGNINLESTRQELNTVTITSGKFKKRIQDVTVSMEILKPGLLQQNHVQSFSDILDKIPGVNYIDGQVNIRGGSGYSYGAGSRVLLLVDNIPALTADAAFANWTDIPVETIAQVEVVKGAGSALYGSAAMNGVINILTRYAKKEAEFDIQAQTQAYLAPSDASRQWWDTPPYRTNISSSFSKKYGKLSVVGAAFLANENSFRKDNYNNYRRVNVKLDYAIRENLIAGVTGNLNDGESQSFFYWKNENAGAYLADSSNYSTSTKTRFTVDPRISYFSPKNYTHRLFGRIYRVSNESDNDQSNYLTSFYGEYQLQKKWEPAGIVTTAGWVSQLSNVDAPLYGDTSFVSLNHALYLQLEKKFLNKLTINTGGRYEINKIKGPQIVDGEPVKQDSFESRPVLRIGLNYKLFPFTNLRVSWGQGYRYPSIAEKFISTTAGSLNIVANPTLEAEAGWTAEIGVRQGIGLGTLKGYVDISAFRSEYHDMIEFNIQLGTFPPKFSAQNIGDTRITGMEISTGFQTKIGKLDWDFQAGYVYLDPVYRNFNDTIKTLSSSDKNILKYRNKHSFKFNTQLRYQGFYLGIGSEYRSFMEAIDIVFNELIPGVKSFRESNTQGTQVWYANLGYRFSHWDISFRMDNLFNEAYTVRPAQLEAPRSVSLKIKYKLKQE